LRAGVPKSKGIKLWRSEIKADDRAAVVGPDVPAAAAGARAAVPAHRAIAPAQTEIEVRAAAGIAAAAIVVAGIAVGARTVDTIGLQRGLPKPRKAALLGKNDDHPGFRVPIAPPWLRLPAFDGETRALNVIIETAQGSRNKLKFDPNLGIFKLSFVLPMGSTFPFDFGFVPSTLGEDGDPLDVLVLMDGPTAPGCLIACRIVGVIEGTQAKKREKPRRNDRLIAVAEENKQYQDVRSLKDLGERRCAEIEHFFVQYNEMQDKVFKPLARRGVHNARKLVDAGIEAYRGDVAEAANGQ
jgi:inorganic pyrophosphatase